MKGALIYIETYGCSANVADSQIMAGLLSRAGYEIVKDPEKADLLIVNTCSVKSTTINKILYRLRELRALYPKKKILAAGCLAATEFVALDSIEEIGICDAESVKAIVNIVSDMIDGKKIQSLGRKKEIKLCLPKMKDNPSIDIIPICSGCASACAFCATRLARGAIFSYPKDKIISEMESATNFGVREFWLTGQDVSAYGLDENRISQLPNLVETITGNVRGNYLIRLGMMNPAHVVKISNELLRAYRSDKIFKFLHLPVQSGSDSVLKRMNRQHTASDFSEIVEKFRRHYPEMTLWTDIITGFPGETDNDFNDTLDMIKKTKPDFVNISQFSCHRATAAAKMKQVPSEKKKQRSAMLTEIAERISLEQNTKWIGWSGKAIVDELKIEKRSWIARNLAYKPIVLRTKQKLSLGSMVEVKIIEASPTCLFGELG